MLTGKEAGLKEAFENGYRDDPDMALYSGGRYRYSGAKLTGLYPVLEVDLPVAGEYVIWARSKYYAGRNKGTYIVQIDSWQSTEFGGQSESQSDSWDWQKDRVRIEKPGVEAPAWILPTSPGTVTRARS